MHKITMGRDASRGVSASNPILSVVLGIVLYEERLTRPAWHVAVAAVALLAALSGAAMITLANRETQVPGGAGPQAGTAAELGA